MQLIRYQNPADWMPRLSSLHEKIDQLFDTPAAWSGNWGPAIDVFLDKDNVYVEVELPGMKKEDIEINFQDGVLSVSGERKEEKTAGAEGEACHRERFYGKFYRAVSMPTKVNAETITANYKDGILTVQLPKAAEVKARQINVTVS